MLRNSPRVSLTAPFLALPALGVMLDINGPTSTANGQTTRVGRGRRMEVLNLQFLTLRFSGQRNAQLMANFLENCALSR